MEKDIALKPSSNYAEVVADVDHNFATTADKTNPQYYEIPIVWGVILDIGEYLPSVSEDFVIRIVYGEDDSYTMIPFGSPRWQILDVSKMKCDQDGQRIHEMFNIPDFCEVSIVNMPDERAIWTGRFTH